MNHAPDPISLRHSQAVWVPIVVWSFCALALGDAIVEGTPGYALSVAVLVTAVSYVVYIVLARPNLLVDAAGITIVNVLHTNRIPFEALVDVRIGGMASVIARTDGGGERKVTSWNAPGVSRRQPQRGDTHPASESETERIIRDRWEAWQRIDRVDADLSVLDRRWNWRELGVAATLIALNIAIVLR